MAAPARISQLTASGALRAGGNGRLAGRTVSRIGFGAMQLERLRTDRRAAITMLRRCIELGTDHIDTAQFYGHGFVNEAIREAVRPEDDVMVVSKVGAEPDPHGPLLSASHSAPNSCAPASRTIWQRLDWNRFPWSTSAVRTPAPACAPQGISWSPSTISSP